MQSINLQIAPGSVNPVINVSQNDVGRQFQLKLYDGAAAYTLPTGTTASIEGIKPDGHAFSYSDAVSVSGSILTVTTKLQMTVVAGRVICEIRLRKSGLDLGSLNFVMLVEESPINENVDPSDTEIPAIIELAEGQVEDAEAWARGTKNGEPVPSTDPQFQNNAKWYAEHVAASLDALSNVNISSPVNEDVLKYDSTTQKWKNSGAVRQLKQALSDEVATRAKTGVHNFCSQTFAKGNYTSAGFVSNTYVASSKGFVLKAGTYILSWTELADHPASILMNYLNIMADETHSTDSNINLGSGNPMTVTVPSDGIYAVQLNVKNAGTNPAYSDAEIATLNSSLVLKLATDAYDGFLPKAPTNAELLSYKDNGVLGAKNFCPVILPTQENYGVTKTVNSIGQITLTGALTQTNQGLDVSGNFILPKGKYILSGCPIFGGYNMFQLVLTNVNTQSAIAIDRGGASGEYPTFELSSDTTVQLTLWLYSAYGNYNGLVISPMVRLATDSDPTYQPFAMTNRQLTNGLNALISQKLSYTVGEKVGSIEGNLILIGNLVIGNFTFYNCNNTNSDPIITIPAGYRPSNVQSGSGLMYNTSGWDNGLYRIYANGELRQAATSAAITKGSCSFAYYIREE